MKNVIGKFFKVYASRQFGASATHILGTIIPGSESPVSNDVFAELKLYNTLEDAQVGYEYMDFWGDGTYSIIEIVTKRKFKVITPNESYEVYVDVDTAKERLSSAGYPYVIEVKERIRKVLEQMDFTSDEITKVMKHKNQWELEYEANH